MSESNDLRGLKLTLGEYLIILVIKLGAYWMSGVMALLGTLSITWGWKLGDPLAAIIVATIIAYNAIGLFRENLSFLLGRSPGANYLNNLESVARSVSGVLGVHDLKAEYIGPEIVHAGMHIEVAKGMPVEKVEGIADEVMHRIHTQDENGFCVIHVESKKTIESTSGGRK